MSSDGAIVGGVVGAVVGFIAGGPSGAIYGAQLGIAAGTALDPPKGPDQKGPRLDDLSTQSNEYGAGIAHVHGTVGTMGTIFWVENNEIREHARTTTSGGKGGAPESSITTYEYYATFAVALHDPGPVAAITKIWIANQLVANRISDDLGTLVETNNREIPSDPDIDDQYTVAESNGNGKYRVYYGTEGQLPDARMQADLGVNNCPAYRGLTYIVFYDWPLKSVGNALMGAQVRAEVVRSTTVGSDITLISTLTQSLFDDGGDYEPGRAWYLSPSKVVFNSPLWIKSAGTTGPWKIKKTGYGVDSAVVTGVVSESDIYGGMSPLAPIVANLPQGQSDSSGATYYDHGVYGIFDYGSGRFAQKNSKTWRFNGTEIYDLDNEDYFDTGSTIYSIFIDDNTYLCVINATYLQRYDGLTLLDQTAHGLTMSGEVHSYYNEGYYYVYMTGTKTVHRLDEDDLTSATTFVIDFQTGADDINFAVHGNILTQSYRVIADSLVYVERWRLPIDLPENVTLDSVVNEELLRSEIIGASDIDTTQLTSTIRGFRNVGVQSIRNNLEVLKQAYPFDLVPSGYTIKCVPRGQSSVKTIDYDDLDARAAGAEPGIALAESREMDLQLPRQVEVVYMDAARQYENNVQRSVARVATSAVNVSQVEVPIVLSANEAAGVAEVLHSRAWVERNSIRFVLPQTYRDLEPGDVVSLTTDDASYTLRLTSINYTRDLRLECDAVTDDSSVYTANAVGDSGQADTEVIGFPGQATLVLLDIPMIRDADNTPGFAVAMAGDGSWPGGTLLSTSDGGLTYTSVIGFASPVTLGYARDSLDQNDGYATDTEGSLTVDLLSSDMELSSVTQAQMMAGQNWAAYGASGRWEIIRFATATLNGDGSYTLSTIVRGLRGTEQYTGNHVDGDLFVLLSDTDLGIVEVETSSIGVTKTYIGVTTGDDVDDNDTQDFAYSGINLKPLSPVYLAGNQSGSDWILTWEKRSRLNSSYWTTGAQTAIGETTESWEIDIMNGSTVVNTYTASTNTYTYTSAQQTTDFGSPQSTVTFRVYLLSATVGRGYKGEATVS